MLFRAPIPSLQLLFAPGHVFLNYGTLKRIALITDPKVIKKILLQLGRWPPPYRPPKQPRPPPPRREETRSDPDPPLCEAEASQLPLWWDRDEAFSQLPFPEEG